MISLQNISAGYGGKVVMHSISLTVNAGDFIALLGSNGSGKSTLLKILAGQLIPSAGIVTLDGRNISSLAPKQRSKRIAYFPQNRPVPRMDVNTMVSHGRFPQLGFGHVMTEADKEAVHQAITQTGLTGLADRLVLSLSGGERQRAYLAMNIAQQAGILLLDEPGSFLDIRHQLEVMDILRTLNKNGKTVIFAAHDLPLSFSYAKRIVLLDKGRLINDAPPEMMVNEKSIEQIFGVRVKQQAGDVLLPYTLARAEGNVGPVLQG